MNFLPGDAFIDWQRGADLLPEVAAANCLPWSDHDWEANSRVSGQDYLHQLASWHYHISVVGDPEINTIEQILTRCAGLHHIDLIAVP
jgi:hypothetical protein